LFVKLGKIQKSVWCSYFQSHSIQSKSNRSVSWKTRPRARQNSPITDQLVSYIFFGDC